MAKRAPKRASKKSKKRGHVKKAKKGVRYSLAPRSGMITTRRFSSEHLKMLGLKRVRVGNRNGKPAYKIVKPKKTVKSTTGVAKVVSRKRLTGPEVFIIGRGLTRKEAYAIARRRARRDHQGFTYNPSTGRASLI